MIRSLNDDKPYDRFLLEQLAGDELPDADTDTLIATGFLRLGPWDDEPADPAQDRFDQLDDIVSTTSEVFLGLTLGCARCHDHKFEPLTSLDYTRMVAVFAPLRRPRNGRTELDLPAGSRAQVEAVAERDRKIGTLRLAVDALRARAANRDADAPGEIRRHEDEIRALRGQTPDLPRGYFFSEPPPEPLQTHLLVRGQASRPGPAVAPGVPAVLVATQPRFLRSGRRDEPSPAHARPMARAAGSPAHGPRHRQPGLAVPLRGGSGPHAQRFRHGRATRRRIPSCSTGSPTGS